MKRDMDLVRNLLLAIESAEGSLTNTTLSIALKKLYMDDSQIPSYQTIVGHIEIMEEAELVSVKLVPHMGGPPAFLGLRMTWHGQDFLANARNSSIWEKARPKMESLSFDLVKQLLSLLVKEAMLP